MKEYLDYLELEKKFSKHTIRAYSDDLKDFKDFLEAEFDLRDLHKVNYNMIRSFIVNLVDSGKTNRTVNRKLSSLRSYYGFLLRVKEIQVSPMSRHKSLKTSVKLQVPFSEKEMEQAWGSMKEDGFEGVRDSLIIKLLYYTGMRRSELIDLKVDDLNSHSESLRVIGKGVKERLIPLLPDLCPLIEEYLELRGQLDVQDSSCFFLTSRGKKLYPGFVYRVVDRFFEKVSPKLKTSPHILRHSFATHLLNRGADINAIKSLLGHQSLSSTQVYVHNDIASLRKIHGKAHPRGGESKS